MKVSADTYFAIVPEWLLDAEVSARAIQVYARLSRFANSQNTARPSRKRLAKLCRCSVKSIDRALRELEAVRAVKITHRYSDDNRSLISSSYKLATAEPRKSHHLGTVVSLGDRDARVA